MKLTAANGLFLLLVAAAAVPPSQAAAEPGEDMRTQIIQEKTELDKLKARLEKQDKAILTAGSKESSVFKRLQTIGVRLKLKERELKIYQYNRKINQEKISRATREIDVVENQFRRQKQILKKRLRSIFKEGNMFAVKVLFSADDFNDLIQRIKYMERVASHDSSLFEKYDDRLRRLENGKSALLNARVKIEKLEKDALVKKDEIKTETTEKSAFLKKLKKEKAFSLKVKDELLAASNNLTNLILKLEEKLERGSGLNFEDKRGWLKLPVRGKFLNKFGKKRDEQFDNFIVYNGVDIKAPKGTPVRSVFSGKVLYANELEGYGNLIILGHGRNYHSLYGHLDEIITKEGRAVLAGQIIGRSGDTGSLAGETLYFELRFKGKPIEPTRWFQAANK